MCRRWMSACGILGCLALSGCELKPVYCDDVAFGPPSNMTVTAMELVGGNMDARAPSPFRTIDDAGVIAATRAFLESRLDYWHAPAATEAVAEFMVDLRGPDGRFPLVGVGMNYLETQGCGGRVIRHLTLEDRAILLELLLDTPVRLE